MNDKKKDLDVFELGSIGKYRLTRFKEDDRLSYGLQKSTLEPMRNKEGKIILTPDGKDFEKSWQNETWYFSKIDFMGLYHIFSQEAINLSVNKDQGDQK